MQALIGPARGISIDAVSWLTQICHCDVRRLEMKKVLMLLALSALVGGLVTPVSAKDAAADAAKNEAKASSEQSKAASQQAKATADAAKGRTMKAGRHARRAEKDQEKAAKDANKAAAESGS